MLILARHRPHPVRCSTPPVGDCLRGVAVQLEQLPNKPNCSRSMSSHRPSCSSSSSCQAGNTARPLASERSGAVCRARSSSSFGLAGRPSAEHREHRFAPAPARPVSAGLGLRHAAAPASSNRPSPQRQMLERVAHQANLILQSRNSVTSRMPCSWDSIRFIAHPRDLEPEQQPSQPGVR